MTEGTHGSSKSGPNVIQLYYISHLVTAAVCWSKIVVQAAYFSSSLHRGHHMEHHVLYIYWVLGVLPMTTVPICLGLGTSPMLYEWLETNETNAGFSVLPIPIIRKNE